MLAILVAVVFFPGWSFRYWQGWACLASFFVPASVVSIYVARNDPALLERRLKAGPRAEKEKLQKVVQSVTMVVFLADFVVPALDHRFGWSHVPAWISIACDLLIVLSFSIVFQVFKVNNRRD
jgi:protein-S-isoprenylcysteine O-methyltransferase Ste14